MKHRTPGSLFIPLTLLIILAAFMMVIPVNFMPQNGLAGIIPNAFYQLANVLSHWIVWVVLILALLMLLVVNNLNKVIERKKFAALSPEDQAKYLEESKTGYLRRLLRSSREKQSDEEEQEIILDHGFDGIKELDNALPQWWLAMFYLGVIYCIIYIVAYFTTDFAHQYDEYEVETARLEQGFADWVKANDIKVDQADMAKADKEHGREIYNNVCATCHMANGGGAAGPNLTDDYWVNKLDDDLYKNIYSVVYDGSPNNPAMQAFGQTKQLTGLDIQDVAAYIYEMNQNQPDVKEAEGGLAPQGDLIQAWKQQ
ncbi:MAG: cbb3-type cytochrome c oxidase N-terminal domain-containing protein [Flavobacteriaceae bacterium]|nr:cbb3-type cytochrome c oxidase N-terminal domain-containing protein [Flavobacteriaceae bacterium]